MKNLKIVVVEDETLIALSIISQLKELGHTVVGDATDGLEAIELCSKQQPDLVIMDINMPHMNGIQAANTIKSKFKIPVVIVSGYSEETLISEAANAGVFSYLVKPVTKQNLAPAIEVALKNHAEYHKVIEESERLKEALEERKLIERAKGILMDRKKLTEPEAMKTLQKMSCDRNVKLLNIAKEIINANELLS